MTAAGLTSLKGSPEETTFQIRLDPSGGPADEVWLWVGGQDAGCNQVEARNQTQGLCAEVPGNPQSVGQNDLVSGPTDNPLTLQDLLDASAGDTQIVTCESSGLTGTPYEIYVFRGAPGGTDVDPSNYGTAPFRVDVEAPATVSVNTSLQRQTNFEITWSNPDPPDDIQLYDFYWSFSDDPSTAERLNITQEQNRTSQTIASTAINPPDGLAVGDTAFIFVTALDQAFVSNPQTQSNISQFSSAVPVTNVAVGGYCDISGDCTGCSASPMTLWGQGASAMPWVLGLLFGVILIWRQRR